MSHKDADLKRIETENEIRKFLRSLKYVLHQDYSRIHFQKERNLDLSRDEKFTNRYTISSLFPDEDETEALRRELSLLKVEEYIETVRDKRFPKRKEMRVFGKKYAKEDVYIKIRVELISRNYAYGNSCIFVMSFHYSQWNFSEYKFPYRKKR